MRLKTRFINHNRNQWYCAFFFLIQSVAAISNPISMSNGFNASIPYSKSDYNHEIEKQKCGKVLCALTIVIERQKQRWLIAWVCECLWVCYATFSLKSDWIKQCTLVIFLYSKQCVFFLSTRHLNSCVNWLGRIKSFWALSKFTIQYGFHTRTATIPARSCIVLWF